MKKHNTNYYKEGERVTSTYAEIYFDEPNCNDEEKEALSKKNEYEDRKLKHPNNFTKGPSSGNKLDDWESPSDILIDKVGLQPPLTSKTVRGQTHQGVLQIGDGVLQAEKVKFSKYYNELLHENDSAWKYVSDYEKERVIKNIKTNYKTKLTEKNKILSKEILQFYETSLQELENSLRSDLEEMILTARANIISEANSEIREKLKLEHNKLEGILEAQYQNEVKKLENYYKLLLDNEYNRCNKIMKVMIIERNDAVKAFYRQFEAETLTSTMYVMSSQRKKCRIRKIMLENQQSSELAEQVQNIIKKQDVLSSLKENEISINTLSKQLEEKIKNIVHIFFKFINYSLQLLPEQSAFLTDLQNLLILQLNEIQKAPDSAPNILQNEEDITNVFKFDKKDKTEKVCADEPFVIEGDPTDEKVSYSGSKDTLPSDISLPMIRVDRQFIYAQCHKFQEVKALLESKRCKCFDEQEIREPQYGPKTYPKRVEKKDLEPITPEESYEKLSVDDFRRFSECPARSCKNWTKMFSFPDLDAYIDFTEENFKRVNAILGIQHDVNTFPELFEARKPSESDLIFTATGDSSRNVAVQCSSVETLNRVTCTCIDMERPATKLYKLQESPTPLNDVLLKRKRSIVRLLHEHPRLLQLFTDEDVKLHI